MCFQNEQMLWESIQSPYEREIREELLKHIRARQGLGATKLPANMPITSPVPTSAYQAMNIPMSYFLGLPYTHRGYGTAGTYGLPSAAAPHTGEKAHALTATTKGASALAAKPDASATSVPAMTPWEIYKANILAGRR